MIIITQLKGLNNMEAIIKVTQSESGKQVVSARELHTFLEVGTNVNNWMKRQAERAMLVENEDFVCFSILESEGRGGQNKVDYAITIQSAKEIAMLNGGEKGKQARLYFIECEKKAQSMQIALPRTYKEALLELITKEEEIEKANEQLSLQAPKVQAFNNVIDNSGTFTVDSLSDMVNIGRNKLFQILRDWKWVMQNEPNGTASTRYAEEQKYARTLFDTIQIGKKERNVKRFVLTKKGYEKAILKLNKTSV